MVIKAYNQNQRYTNYDMVIIPKDISMHTFWENNIDCPGVIGQIELTEDEIISLSKKTPRRESNLLSRR